MLEKVKKKLFKDIEVVSLKSRHKPKGGVLLSYIVYPFLNKNNYLTNSHTNFWECFQIANTFLKLGYDVDVINWDNYEFIPKKKYRLVIDIHNNLDRLDKYLDKSVIKIIHLTGSHWLFQNHAELTRLLELKKRKGVILPPKRLVPPSFGVEHADVVTLIGNNVTAKTYNFNKKLVFKLPVSTTVEFDFIERNFNEVRKNFLWLGGSGLVHKGLDIVLETFSKLPDYNLTVCGPISDEADFENIYYKELYLTENIKTVGWIDVNSNEFKKIISETISLVYPTCSEGQSGAVVACLHAGLIPITTDNCGINYRNFGVPLKDISVASVTKAVKSLSTEPKSMLEKRSKKAWIYAKKNHTRKVFSRKYTKAIKKILSKI